MDARICQQCKAATDATANRLVRDSCGHYKCRSCVVKDSHGCRTCLALAGLIAEVKLEPRPVISVAEVQAELLNRDSISKTAEEDPSNNKKKKRDGATLPNNIIVFHDEGGTWYQCTVCQKQSRARSHITYHSYCGREDKPHHCSICDKGFSSRSHYDYHMRVHEGKRPYVCDTCSASFFQKSKLKRHVLKHTGEKRFGCNECGAAFNNAASLRKHSFIHSGLKPHKCPTCDRQFRDSSNLRKHESKHKDLKHECSHCGKKYGVKGSLVLHARKHAETRPFRCPQCPQAFYSNKDMRRHTAVHTGNKPYRCLLCKTRFRRKDNLDRHLRNTHPGHDIAASYEIVHEPDPALETPATAPKDPPRQDDITEQNILEANNRRQTVIFGPIKPPDIKREEIEALYKEKHFKKKNMEIYRNILMPNYSESVEGKREEKPEPIVPEYIHKKWNYELVKRGERVYCSQVPPISSDSINRIVRDSNLYPDREGVNHLDHPPEKLEIYKKILVPDYSVQPSTSDDHRETAALEGERNGRCEGDVHWRRRMANMNR